VSNAARDHHAGRPGPRFVLATAAAPRQRVRLSDLDHDRVLRHEAGALLVLGGPGTGKTTLLVRAVAERVRRGVVPEQVLALTLTAGAARSLRGAIAAELDHIVGAPMARTPYSYCYGLLRAQAIAAGLPSPRLLGAPERDLVLRELLDGRLAAGVDRWPAELRVARQTRAFVDELSDLLARAAERNIGAADLAGLGRRHNRPEWACAAEVLDEYTAVTSLQKPGAFDAPELIHRALDALHGDHSLLLAERRRLRRIFVDEYADFDPAQRELIELLGEGADEVVIFSDPDQSIHAFRGADPASVGPDGRNTPTVILSRAFRAGAALAEATSRVSARLSGPVHTRLATPHSGAQHSPLGGPALTVRVFANPADEAAYLGRELRHAHLRHGVPWSEMAVIVRAQGAQTQFLRRRLSSAGVPVHLPRSAILAEEPTVALLLRVLRILLDPRSCSDQDAELLLTSAVGRADPLLVQRLRRRLARAGRGDGELGATLLEPAAAALAVPALQRSVTRIQQVFTAGRDVMNGTASELIWAVWQASGLGPLLERRSLAGGLDGARADRGLDAVIELFHEAAELSERQPGGGPAALIEWIARQQITGAADDATRPAGAQPSVQLLSAHAAKGRQWALVCVAGVQEGVWPDNRQRGTLLGSDVLVDLAAGRHADSVDRLRQRQMEERRLFYVAVTRASSRLIVTGVCEPDSAPSRFIDELDPPLEDGRELSVPEPALDLTGLVGQLRSVLQNEPADAGRQRAAAQELARLADAGIAAADPANWWGADGSSTTAPALGVGQEIAISASRLQSYLDCQLRGLLEDLAATDGRPAVEANVGTLIHQVAEQIDDDAEPSALEALADQLWPEVEFLAPWHAKVERVRASRMLAKLAAWLVERRGRLTLIAKEQPFSVVVGDVRLSGRVDRLERDRSGALIVVDLKATKRAFSVKDVEEHAQLAVYQLAVELAAFEDNATAGGALLVHLGKPGRAPAEMVQKPLARQDDPARIPAELARLSGTLRAPTVAATVNSGCGKCPVRTSCPAQDEGRQVAGS
jgi:superfamily I DNA/RNA helicase/RecB family exonuclease